MTSYMLISAKVKRSAISDTFCRHSQSEFDWTVAICHETQRHSTPVKSVRRRFLRNPEDLQQCRANMSTLIESRETFTNEKTRSHPASKPRMAALRNTTHETTNQHHKKEPQHGKTHCFSSEQFATDCRSQFFCSWHFLAHGRQLSSHSRSNGEERHSGNHMQATGGFPNTSM